MGRRMFLSGGSLPNPPQEAVVRIEQLSGGLNLQELEYRLDADESPEMKNLWWRDGLLGCRDGQEYVNEQAPGAGIAAYGGLFWGHGVFHIGDGIYAGVPGTGMALRKLWEGLPEIRGTFLKYQDRLLYKTKGAFLSIGWDGEGLTAEAVAAYTPVTVINCGADGSGDLYQPENRLSSKKTVWYTAAWEQRAVSFAANGTAKIFSFQTDDGEPVAAVEQVYVGSTLMPAGAYTVSADGRTITFDEAPAEGETVTAVFAVGVRVYHLPETAVDAVTAVTVNGEQAAYSADLEAGTVTLETAAPWEDPVAVNGIHITYEKANPDARKAIDDCRYAVAYGGTGGAVLVLAGSQAQPNGYFWNGSHIAMDPGYFPMEYYNLAGDNLEPVTGFGEQAGYLVVFQAHRVGRCLLGTNLVGDRAYLTLDYTPVNAVLGCDLPWTIRLVENNLVWCSTYAGVCRLEDTTAALENQVRRVSGKVNGGAGRPGLLEAVRNAETVCALEDGARYWVAADGAVYVWDHKLSSAGKPSWFYFENVPAVAFFQGEALPEGQDDGLAYTGARRLFHLDGNGRVTRFVRTFRDYGGAIEKVYRFAVQNFGGYQRLKHVKELWLATRSDTDTVIEVTYETDQGKRTDPTPIVARSWRLVPRDLGFRYLGIRRFAQVAVRRPRCRYVRHFGLRLENREAGCDMSIVSARMRATLVAKER